MATTKTQPVQITSRYSGRLLADGSVRLYRIGYRRTAEYVGTVGSWDEAEDAAIHDRMAPDMSEATSPCGWRAPR